jgi:hypothetical protein
MVTTTTPRSAFEGRDEPDDDWPSQAADTIERVVGTVRDRTTGPLLKIAKTIVYGTFAVLVGLAALVVAVIGAVRALNSYLPDQVFGDEHMWAAYLIMGLIFVLAGGVLWSRRRAPEQTSAD